MRYLDNIKNWEFCAIAFLKVLEQSYKGRNQINIVNGQYYYKSAIKTE